MAFTADGISPTEAIHTWSGSPWGFQRPILSRADFTAESAKSLATNRQLASGCALKALVVPDRKSSGFHSVGTCIRFSTTPLSLVMSFQALEKLTALVSTCDPSSSMHLALTLCFRRSSTRAVAASLEWA